MSGLIEEIQRKALDASTPIDDLLRRVKLAAAKLQLDRLGSWVEHELSGYDSDIPKYRRVYGQPVAWNPVRGWIPIFSDDERLMDSISTAPVSQSVASIRDLISNNSGGLLSYPMPSPLVAFLNTRLDFQTAKAAVQFSRGSMVEILDTVRNMVLNWSIEMEAKGIIGEGLSFDVKEKVQAQAAMTTFNIGQIGTFTGNLGSGNQSGDITATVSVVKSIQEASAKIRGSLPQLIEAGADGQTLRKSLDALDVEAASTAPDASKLGGMLTDVRAALSGAAGSMLAEGGIALLAPIIKALGG